MTELGEQVKLARLLGYQITVGDDYGYEGEHVESYLDLTRHSASTWPSLVDEIVALSLLEAVTSGRSLNDIAGAVQQSLINRHAPMSSPIQDVMGIGEGHRDDEHGPGRSA